MDPDLPDLDRSFLPSLDEAFARHADRTCTIFGDDHRTYADIDAASARVANALTRDGFEPGQHGAVYSRNSGEAFVSALGIVRAGGVWVPLNPSNSPPVNLEILSRFDCDALLYEPEYTATAAEMFERLGGIFVRLPGDDANGPGVPNDEWLVGAADVAPTIECQGSDTLCLPQTGGTTGVPKGVMLSHRNFSAMAWATQAQSDGSPRVTLVAAPMTHVVGRAALVQLVTGNTSVILETVDLDRILDAIEQHRITDLFLPPSAIYSLLDHQRTPTTDFSSLCSFGYGSAPMSIPRLRQAFATFGPVMRGGFGQTECPMYITRHEPAEHFVDGDTTGELVDDDTLRSVGRETILSTLAIVDDDANPLPPHTRGEIAVQGPMVSEGYYQDPEATAAIRQNGWHLTGDIGVLDDTGRLYIVDRKKDMIISGGFNVHSTDVEAALHAIDGVAEAAVIGVPSERWGESVKAIVRRADSVMLTEDDIIDRCKDAIGSVMAPKSVDFVSELPKTAVGKIDKKRLRAPYWAATSRDI
ncbi:MAG: long-chain fatty acid--CoA ligase [Acidimicrobiaceae bacterium]|nr:long-chain fatty acid--CoA ligase [Acidimicrobiaceae bacterium]MYD07652.1 long-chain fatty acid--CoA ligase [Acidimicrobiaceae bacterium]MYI59697.1 long-chain fatty acid--CoA ligase [Acidimicrobiaceae bacterium]